MREPVLVTGAGGFIGSHLVEELVGRGIRVRAMVHYNSQNRWGWIETLGKKTVSELEIKSGDVSDLDLVRKAVAGCKTVFHLAALIGIPYSYISPSAYVRTNIVGTLNVAQACMDEGVERMIHTSTSETYGTAQHIPINEKHPLVGQSPYAASKIGADKLAESFYLSFGLPVATVRPFNTFGPRQSARAIVPTVITQALAGSKVIRLGSLTPVRDMTYVKDTVQGFVAAAECEDAIGQVVNLGRGEGIHMGDLVQIILDICKMEAEVHVDDKRLRPEKSEVMTLVCDNSRAKSVLGWFPRYSLRDGLESTVRWIQENITKYKPDHYNV